MKVCAVFAALAFAGVGGAMAQKPVKACNFDTAAHTDTLALDFSLRAYRGSDSVSDPVLTRGFGDIFRAHFAPTPTIGQLFYPGTYRPSLDRPKVLTTVFGALQFNLSSTGVVTDLKWFAVSDDPATDDALEAAMRLSIAADELKMFAGLFDSAKPGQVRLQFLASNDTISRAPLFRMRVPLLRVDKLGPLPTRISDRGGPLPVEVFQAAYSERSEFSAIIDRAGKPVKESVRIIDAPSLLATQNALAIFMQPTYGPFTVGGCPVPLRMLVHADKRK